MVSVIKILYKSYIYHFPYNTCYTPTNNHYGLNQYNWRPTPEVLLQNTKTFCIKQCVEHIFPYTYMVLHS